VMGLTAASLDTITYYLLTRSTHLNEYLANFIGINIGISVSFYLNAFYNFKKTDKLKARAAKFFLVGYVGLLLSMIILYLGTRVLIINDIYVKVGSIFVVAAFQFVLNKLFTFQEGK